MEIRNYKIKLMKNVYIVILLQFLVCYDIRGEFLYGKNTQSTLCSAQCEALCMDRVPQCESLCQGNRSWITNCDGPHCPGTCSVLVSRYHYQINNLVPSRKPNITQIGTRRLELSWQQPSVTPLTTIFVIEQKTNIYNTSVVHMIGWIRGTRFVIEQGDVCDTGSSYRVMAVNQFGSMGFSNYIKVPGLKPGPVQSMKFSGQGVYYYKKMSQFMAILEWSLPAGWNETDIDHYDVNPVVKTKCDDLNHLSLPLFRQMQNQTKQARRILMTIAAGSVGCIFTPEIRAVSRCNIYGPWTGFTVDLTNCSTITGYTCQPKVFDPPGNAENVSLDVSPTMDPFAVNLHIRWLPPIDLGSSGVIEKYMIRSGKAVQLTYPLPASFTDQPVVRNVSQEIRELIFQLRTEQIPFTYGVQVIPLAPGQNITENEMGMLPMETIQAGHNDSLALFRQQGTILLDKNGVVIVYMNKDLPVQFMFDTSQGRSGNSTAYALQWGPLIGPNRLFVENNTVVPMAPVIYDDGGPPINAYDTYG